MATKKVATVEDQHPHLDLDTLAEVHRVLSSTEFASVQDLAARGLTGVPGSVEVASGRAGGVPADAAGADPLPRRR
jgi:hypothetical protein